MEFNDFTLFNSFRKHKKIYLILSINNLPPKDLYVEADKINVGLTQSYVKNCYEPIQINIYDLPIDKKDKEVISLTVEYNGLTYSNVLRNTKHKKGFMALTTLFKDDYTRFPIFYKYYKNRE